MADNNRTSIYLSPRLIEEKAKWKEASHGGFSSRLTNAIARLEFIADNCRPAFTKAEWFAVLDTLNGYFMADDMTGIVGIPFGLIDAIEVDELDKKWEFEASDFIEKVRNLTPCELISIAETADEFWRRPDQNLEKFIDRIVQEAGFERPYIRPSTYVEA